MYRYAVEFLPIRMQIYSVNRVPTLSLTVIFIHKVTAGNVFIRVNH